MVIKVKWYSRENVVWSFGAINLPTYRTLIGVKDLSDF